MAVANHLNLRVLPRGLVRVAAAFMLCVGLAAAAIAENRVTKVVPIEAVEAITLTGAAELIIRQGKEASLEVRAPVDVLANIKVKQADSRLILGQKQSKSFWWWFGSKNESSDVTFIVTVKNLSALHVAGAARVRLDSLNSPQLMLELTGAAQMHISNAVLERLQVNLTGASRCNIDALSAHFTGIQLVGASQMQVNGGDTVELNVESVGASRLRADAFKAVTAKVHAVGASQATVYASKALTANATGASNIRYAGEPVNVQADTAGASKVGSL